MRLHSCNQSHTHFRILLPLPSRLKEEAASIISCSISLGRASSKSESFLGSSISEYHQFHQQLNPQPYPLPFLLSNPTSRLFRWGLRFKSWYCSHVFCLQKTHSFLILFASCLGWLYQWSSSNHLRCPNSPHFQAVALFMESFAAPMINLQSVINEKAMSWG